MEQEKKAKEKKEKPKKSLQREIFEWIMVLVVAAALAFVVRTFIFEPVRVDGSSMLNTLENNEFMIATKFDYLAGDPERFDVVICDYPNTDDGMYRVKRVIGLPGETIELKKGELYVNGEFVEQNFEMTPNETDFGPFTVPGRALLCDGRQPQQQQGQPQPDGRRAGAQDDQGPRALRGIPAEQGENFGQVKKKAGLLKGPPVLNEKTAQDNRKRRCWVNGPTPFIWIKH